MKKGLYYAVTLFFFLIALSAQRAIAAPNFARQTGMACNACHFQHFAVLNAFGRSFKSGGYTLVGGQSLIEGDLLSIPSTLNAALFTKINYDKRNGKGQSGDEGELNKGQLQFPSDTALLIGGRGGEHLGFLLEASLKDGDSRFTSFKMPVVFDVSETKMSFIPFTTDGNGPSYGFELLNTGSIVIQLPLEHSADVSAQQYIGVSTAATGFAFVASQSLGFANYTMWSPVHGTKATGPYLHYARLAVTPTVSGLDLGAGVQWWGGTSKTGPGGSPQRDKADAWAIDAQMQGIAGPFPLGVYASYATAKKSDTAIANIFNSSTKKARAAFAILAELGVIPNRLTAGAAYRAGKNGDHDGTGKDTDNAATLALTYNATQNLLVKLTNTWYSGNGKAGTQAGNMLSSITLFGAF